MQEYDLIITVTVKAGSEDQAINKVTEELRKFSITIDKIEKI